MRDEEQAEQAEQAEKAEKTEKAAARRNTRPKRGFLSVLFGRGAVAALMLLAQFVFLFVVFGRLQQYSIYLSGTVTALTAVFLAYLLNTRSNPSVKLTWAVIIAVVPVFGVLLYLFITFDIGHRAEQQLLQGVEEESAPFMPAQEALMARLRREEPDFAPLARYLARANGYAVYDNTDAAYFPQGEDKYEAMLRELEKAEKFIFLEYFIVEEGEMWDGVVDILARKAAQGVDVRVLYDGTCSILRLPASYPKRLRALGIHCKVFAPIRPFISTSYNNRDHRKILVVDGKVGFTGGVNLADEYINRRERFGHWKDAAVMLRGDAVRSLTLMFLRMWNAGEKERVYEPFLIEPAAAVTNSPGCVIPYGDSPLDSENTGEMVYLDMIATAREYVYIMTPYLILDNEMVTALTLAARRGVDVRLILPGIPDKKYANILAKSHYKVLTEAGVRLFEYTPGFVHSKVFVSDGNKAVVGTINLDYRSLYLHFECAAYLYKVPAIADILKDFADTFPQCREISPRDAAALPLSTRLLGSLLKLAAPLM